MRFALCFAAAAALPQRPRRATAPVRVMILDGERRVAPQWALVTPVLKKSRRDRTVPGRRRDGTAAGGDFSAFKPAFRAIRPSSSTTTRRMSDGRRI